MKRMALLALGLVVVALSSAEIRQRPPTGEQRPPIGPTRQRPEGTVTVAGVGCPCVFNRLSGFPPTLWFPMNAAGMTTWKGQCTPASRLSISCATPGYVQGYCVGGGPALNLGYWRMEAAGAFCETYYWDTGANEIWDQVLVNAEQKTACLAAIASQCP